ncbi:TPA: hypothetical protein ACH3X2_013350 [Trebouxia sp. C0005]
MKSCLQTLKVCGLLCHKQIDIFTLHFQILRKGFPHSFTKFCDSPVNQSLLDVMCFALQVLVELECGLAILNFAPDDLNNDCCSLHYQYSSWFRLPRTHFDDTICDHNAPCCNLPIALAISVTKSVSLSPANLKLSSMIFSPSSPACHNSSLVCCILEAIT